ncbi:MAG: insulinase family protein [Bacteroidales bacterium]|nr:insulinase family protein [Bacteroidales bacterium]
MTIPDRSKQPEIFGIEMPNIPSLEHTTLSNGADLYVMHGGTQPITRVDICLNAGPHRAKKAGVAHATSVMIGEGIPGMNSEQIAEKIDFYGAQMWQRSTGAYTVISFFVLDKFLCDALPIIEQMIKCPTFPQKEIDIYLKKELQQLRIKLKKPSFFAAHTFTNLLYEEGCVYGRVSTEENIKSITRDDIVAFHKETYTPQSLKIFISGQPSQRSIDEVARAFGSQWCDNADKFTQTMPVYRKWETQTKIIDFPGAMQASIHMDKVAPGFEDPDSIPLNIANTIFGGYFGSRLMSNIREEKGLTYGIGSTLIVRNNGGHIRITSEVEPTKYDIVVKEIANEMNRMRNELVGEDELLMVKNYMKGSIMSKYETVIVSIDNLIPIILEGGSYRRDCEIYNMIEKITAEEIMELSNRYFIPEDYKILIVK